MKSNGVERQAVMTKKEWERKIIAACKEAGTYQKPFKYVIDTLAQIMSDRDKVHEEYVAGGAKPVVVHVNNGGTPNVAKNPLVMMEGELNAQALAYWRDLGLTPAGLKKLNASAVKDAGTKSKSGSLEKLLEDLADD